MKEKFQQLIYAEVFLNTEGHTPTIYIINIRLGISGNDIILQSKSDNLGEVFRKSTKSIQRYLAKNKEKKSKKRNEIFYKKAY